MPRYQVRSSTTRGFYRVNTDEQTCTCKGWEFCKTDPKWCSHLQLIAAYPKGHALITQASA